MEVPGILAKIEELLDSPDYTDNKIGVQMMEVYQRENPVNLSLIETPSEHRLIVAYWKWYNIPTYDAPTVARKTIAIEKGTRKQLFQCGWNVYNSQFLYIGIDNERQDQGTA
jgi:hypothetical protein